MEQSHYFIADETLEDHEETFFYYFDSHKIELTSNSGMFAPGHVDAATDLLLHTLPNFSKIQSLLDLGCGYGVIGITLKKAYSNLEVTMSDVNARALRYAQKNAQANAVKIKNICTDGFQNNLDTYDAITLNPPIHAGKETIFQLYEDSFSHLNANGSLYIVIQKKHGAESTIQKLQTLFPTVETLYKKKGYYILKATK